MLDEVASALGACGSLATALRVGLAQAPRWHVVDVVIQDEFTHDVIFGIEGAGPDAPTIVLDCT